MKLCRATEYRATHIPGTPQGIMGVVTVTAIGAHPTPGFRVFLERTPGSPGEWPDYVLRHIPPDELVPDLPTPFVVSASFETAVDHSFVNVEELGMQRPVPVKVIPVTDLPAEPSCSG